MLRRAVFCCIILLLSIGVNAGSQVTPWYYWTLLPQNVMDEIIGESSGETCYNTIMEMGGYNKNRLAEEYHGIFYETQYLLEQLKNYNITTAEKAFMPGGEVWDAIKGELWETKPLRQKLASYTDMTAMLAKGSSSADVTAELVWVGNGTREEIERVNVSGKIVVTEGSVGSVHNIACINHGAEGVIYINNSRPLFDPLQIPWSSIGSRRQSPTPAPTKFAFMIPPREGWYLKQRLMRGEKITVHAQVETTMEPYDLENVVCTIPGTDPNATEVILSAHMFEGYTKQGASDNKSGCAGILEAARVLHTLINEGRIPPPKRTIRFLWGPEFSGTGPWVKAHGDIMEKTLCNINMDMVGEWLVKNKAFMCLMRTTYGNPHYINDVMENYYRFVGEGNKERIQNRSGFYKVAHRIVSPNGSDEPFYYSIETHYGASDHEVFNDWGVGVPGIMMIVWPDQWYHTSGDRPDKVDPTQMKRVAVIGAAGAYTVACADDDMAIRIAGETTSNGTRRLGHQLIRGLEELNNATAETLSAAYKKACIYIETAVVNEKATLASVNELADDQKKVGDYVKNMQKTIDDIGKTHLAALETHMQTAAQRLNTKPVKVQMTDEEKQANKIVPKETAKVKMSGYRGWQELISQVSRQERSKYPYQLNRSVTSELPLLINGKNSVYDIKIMLDAQYKDESSIKDIINYLEILKLAGLVEM